MPENVAKAYLKFETGTKVDCWFNPKDFTLSKNNKWEIKTVTGQDLPTVQFGGSDSQKISLDLLFDDTDSDQGDVRNVCNTLFDMMKPNAQFKTGDNNNERPPKVEFGWGNFVTFKAVCDSLSIQYTMFKPDGTPIRAQAKLGLTQVEPAVLQGGGGSLTRTRQNPTTTGVAGLRSHVFRDGDSLQSIAYAAYGDATKWRKIAEANGIDDPMRLKRGTILTIPRLSE
jgi:hypothetical protein